MDPAEARDYFIELAAGLGLDTEQFAAELDDGVHAAHVSASEQEAIRLGLPGTPSAIVNGEIVAGESLPRDFAVWDEFVRAMVSVGELVDRQYDEPPPMALEEELRYFARVIMEDGDEFVIELLPESAPQTVNSFVFLANEGWFDNTTFHRVISGFVAQAGDPSGTGLGGPGYTLPDEIDEKLSHVRGMVAMANTGPNTSGSQWYVTLADVANLDGGYTIFGRVIEGMDVVDGLTPREAAPGSETPPGDSIRTIVIETEE
jgi:cyclophilin family peptidyl-prolyl cis-trans isomerase